MNQMNKIEKGHWEGLKSLKPKSLFLSLPKQYHLQGTKWSFVSDYEGHLIQTSTDSILD